MKKNHFITLSKKWHKKHKELHGKLWQKHKDALEWFADQGRKTVLTSVSGLMLLSSPSGMLVSPTDTPVITKDILDPIHTSPHARLRTDLSKVLPDEVRELTPEEEEKIGAVLSNSFGFRVAAELEGIRLNRSYGLIGQEQHLARYPGDNMSTHFTSEEDAAKYGAQGMAPGLGAWGYFSPSYDQLSQKDIDREKYYIATQTFLAPGFAEHTREYITFFKYRKMLVVNPQNGKAMVVDIADAGPGSSTGKHLGGSPEVMKYLERVDGRARGPVLYYFIDDPNDTISLGPVNPKLQL